MSKGHPGRDVSWLSLSFLRAHKAEDLASQKAPPVAPPGYVILGIKMKRSRKIQHRHHPHSRPCPLQPETQRATVSATSPKAFFSSARLWVSWGSPGWQLCAHLPCTHSACQGPSHHPAGSTEGWLPSLWLTTARKASPSMAKASQSLALCVAIRWCAMNFAFLRLHLKITENS